MKKINLSCVIFIAMFFLSVDASSQSFLKKLSKGINNVTKEIDKILDTDTPEETEEDQQPDDKTTGVAANSDHSSVQLGLNIPKTTGVMSINDAYNQHDSRKRMTAAERNELKINSIKNTDFDIKWTNGQLSKGKVIYSGEQGTLQTILFIENDHASAEYLISYNPNGDVVDCISIGSISAYGGDRGEAVVEGNKITVRFSAEGSSLYILYRITPDLKFVKEKQWEVED